MDEKGADMYRHRRDLFLRRFLNRRHSHPTFDRIRRAVTDRPYRLVPM